MTPTRSDAHARISEAEWTVMDLLWDRSPLGSAEVSAALSGTGWSPKTVQTLLGRLVKKGCLAYDDQGGRYLYRPAVAREQAVREESRSFLDRVFGGDASSLMAHFARRADLSAAEIDELRRLLDERAAGDTGAEGGEGSGRKRARGSGDGGTRGGGEGGR